MSFFAELKRRNVVKIGAAYLVVAWLLIQVAATVAPQLQLPEWAPRLITLMLLIGFPVALLMAWMLERAPEGLKIEPAAFGNKRMAVIAIVLAAFAVGWYLRGAPEKGPESISGTRAAVKVERDRPEIDSGPISTVTTSKKSIAVLPFVNMSGDPEQEFFADGLSEEILNSLTRIDGMQVVGRTSSFRFKGKNEDLRTIGEQLGVANVLEGSVRRGKDRARITAQLIRVADGIHLWSQTYDRTLEDTLAVQLDIAENVAGALDVVLDDAQRERMRKSGVKNVDAFIAFQKGLQLFAGAHDPARSENLIATLREANVEFARATTLEPGLALAHQFSTDLYSHIIMSDSATAAERVAALELADRSLDLAARHSHDSQQRHFAELDRQLMSNDWRGLAGRFAAVYAEPGCGQSNWMMVGSALGFAEQQLAYAPQILACDPLSGFGQVRGAEAANWVGLPERSLEFVTQTDWAGHRPTTITLHGVRALAALGRIDEARAMLATMEGASSLVAMGQLIIAVAAGDDLAEIRARQAEMDRGGWNPELWTITDGFAENFSGDRAAANRRAATMDAQPGGPLRLAVYATLCYCGAPFDLEFAPNFKARLEESGLRWPPPDTMKPSKRIPGAGS